jgi:5'-nucleotidase
MLAQGLRPGMLLNVNVPQFRPGVPKGVRVAPMAIQLMGDQYESTRAADGTVQYWLRGGFADVDHHHETDLRALLDGHIVVTPLQFDLTDPRLIREVGGWSWPPVR